MLLKNIKDRTRRHLKIVADNKINDEQIDEIIENGQANDVIKQALFVNNMEEMMKDIKNRHEEIMKLEQSVLEIHELFKDLSNLVDLQQESLDIIEQRVKSSNNYVKAGATKIVKAHDYAKKTRKRKCCLLIIFLMILLAILFTVLLPTLGNA